MMLVKNSTLLVILLGANLAFLTPGYFIYSGHCAESFTFSGTWVANGSKEVLPFGKDRDVALLKLSGHVNLKNQVGNESDYWAECIGLADTKTGSIVRCVWKSLGGQEIYLTLKGERFMEGSSVTGNISGGNNSAKGITGTIQFKWSSMSVHSTNNTNNIGGYAKELTGSYQLP